MSRIVRSGASLRDAKEISLYISRDDLEAAHRWVDQLDDKLKMLASFPGAGVARDDLLPGMRSFPVGKYLIFYKAIRSGIEVVRVIHGARNLRKIFREHPKK